MGDQRKNSGCRCFGCSFELLAQEIGDEAATLVTARELGVDPGNPKAIAASVRASLHGVGVSGE